MTTINRNHFRILLNEIIKSARVEGEHAKTPIAHILEKRTETLVDGFMRELDGALKPVDRVEVSRDAYVKLMDTGMRYTKREPVVILDYTLVIT